MPLNKNNRFVRNHKPRQRKPVFLLTCEGDNKTETNYFAQFKQYGINAQFAKCNETDIVNMAKHHCKECKELEIGKVSGDCSFVLCDMDLSISKEKQIKEAKLILKGSQAEIIVSNPCFELWYLLLCKELSAKQYNSNDELINDLKKAMPGYTKSKIIDIDSFPCKIEEAVSKAKKLEEISKEVGRVKHTISFNPNTDIYKVIGRMNELSGESIYNLL